VRRVLGGKRVTGGGPGSARRSPCGSVQCVASDAGGRGRDESTPVLSRDHSGTEDAWSEIEGAAKLAREMSGDR
jgi:hypothetical protein